MDNQEQDIVERLKKANNVLVTVSNNPSVDQLAACIGLTLALNKLDKHATAVFSGQVPSTIEFLQPEETLEKNTDSLRDFIISLDKSKADKLRYKVEDRVVRIFITPYKTSISDADLEFSQGDFNVDVVLALGVQQQKDLDQAITAHGRIMHDATVITVNTGAGADLGAINWQNAAASSLSEMATTLTNLFDIADLIDQQIATAYLTGIVAETERFSNNKTTANTMNASAALMAAGANQQLVAQKLQEPSQPVSLGDQEMTTDGDKPAEAEKLSEVQISDDGTLEIDHKTEDDTLHADTEPEVPEAPAHDLPEISTTHTVDLPPISPEPEEPKAPANYDNPRTHISAPTTSNQPAFTSGVEPEKDEQLATYANPLNLPPIDPQPTPAATDHSNDTLQDLEREVQSTHLDETTPTAPVHGPTGGLEELDLQKLERPSGLDEEPAADLDAARNAVAQAMADQPTTPETPAAFNSTMMADNLHAEAPAAAPLQPVSSPSPDLPPLQPLPGLDMPADQPPPMTMPLPPFPGQSAAPPSEPTNPSPNDPPPVPPPIVKH